MSGGPFQSDLLAMGQQISDFAAFRRFWLA